MSYENIRFSKSNMVVDSGYFYMFDETNDLLTQKLDDGSISFIYPLDTPLSNTVKSCEFDGIYFWTLENPGTDSIIKRWKIENNTCNLKDTFVFGDLTDPDGICESRTVYGLSYLCSKAFDNNESSGYYHSASGYPHWIGYDFGVGNQKKINKVRIKFYYNHYSETVVVQGSNSLDVNWEDKAWTDIYTMTGIDSSGHQWNEREFTNNIAYRFYRLYGAAAGPGGNTYWCIWEIEMMIISLDSESFTVEHYHTSLSTTISGGDGVIQVSNYYDTVISGGVTLTIGPNGLYQYEDVVVNSVSGTNITLVSGTQYDYEIGDDVGFYLYLWVFDNDGDGSLCKIDARTGTLLNRYYDSEYDDIKSCTFYKVTNVFDNNVDALIYVKSNNLKFISVDDLSTYGTMIMDNLRVDGITVIPIYDISIDIKNVYRLQGEATYYGVDNDWGDLYNYQVSTTRPFVDSITVAASPLILPANAKNVTQVTAAVFDQYGNGSENKPVSFTDDDSVGYILTNPAYTDYFFGTGQAKTAYRAGVVEHTVNIEGTVTQYD